MARMLSSIISHNQTSALEKNGNSTSILTPEYETIDDDGVQFVSSSWYHIFIGNKLNIDIGVKNLRYEHLSDFI